LGGDVGGVDGFFVLREDAASGPLDQVPEGVGDDEVRVEVTEEDGGFPGLWQSTTTVSWGCVWAR